MVKAMVKCERCGKIVGSRNDLTLVRIPGGRWQVQCRDCVRSAATAMAKSPKTMSASPAAKALSSPSALFSRIAEILAEMEQESAPPRQHERAHERFPADLVVRYALQRDDELYTAHFKDISEGGARFITDRELQPRQILRFEINAETLRQAPGLIQSTGEVRRVTPLGDGRFEVGVRFVKRLRGQEPNRRRYRRVRVDLAVYFRRQGSELVEKGRVHDISQGGVRLLADAALSTGEEMDVIIRSEGAAAGKADIHGRVRIVRTLPRRRGETEAGCAFLTLRLRPRPAAPEEKT
ncbi:MAG: PilZ domain-containing protein [Planctomycetota bacterium]|nr:PilZ domain-containing protein [Planctomycetota bacterium]